MLHDLEKLAKTKHPLGYSVVYYPVHPKAWKGTGLIYLHRLVMENYLNRFLEDDEIVHHLDENRNNNDISNLQLTTRQEHSKLHFQKIPLLIKCKICNKDFKPDKEWTEYCSRNCYYKDISKNIPSKEDLENIIWKIPTIAIAKIYNVSDTAVAKWCKKYNIQKPPRGYWSKNKKINGPEQIRQVDIIQKA